MNMKTILAGAFLCFTGIANAGEIIVDIGSYHIDRTYDLTTTYVDVYGNVLHKDVQKIHYNNANPGIGYRTDNGWMVGYYDNSYNKTTIYAAKEWMFTEHLGIILGLGSGYKFNTGHNISPVGGINYKLPLTDTLGVDVIMLPPIGKMSGVIHVAMSFKLNK